MKQNLFIILVILIFAQCTINKKSSSTVSSNSQSDNNSTQQVISSKNSQEKQLNGSWNFDYFTMHDQKVSMMFPLNVPVLNFDVKGNKFSGSAGCNNISGNIQIKGNNQLQFLEPMIMTRMACNARGESIFVEYLKQIQAYNIEDQILKLIGQDGKPLIIMKRAIK